MNAYRTFTPSRGAVGRQGFTLVELLMVIAIIGILAGLITVAANSAMYSAKQTRIKMEVDQLSSAIKAFKEKFGAYPPCDLRVTSSGSAAGTSNPPLFKFLKKAFPRYVTTPNTDTQLASDMTRAGADIASFNPPNALVFWLSGLSPDVSSPLTGQGTRTPLFDFDKTRLLSSAAGLNGVAWQDTDGDGIRSAPGTDLYTPLIYVPQGGNNVPYVYFDSATYSSVVGTSAPPPFNAQTAFPSTNRAMPNGATFTGPAVPSYLSSAGFATPYVLDVNKNSFLNASTTFTDGNSNGTWDSGESVSGGAALLPAIDDWANADSFQIISAGQDGQYSGAAGAGAAGATTVRLYPTGAGYSADTSDNDNVANFSDKSSIGDAKP